MCNGSSGIWIDSKTGLQVSVSVPDAGIPREYLMMAEIPRRGIISPFMTEERLSAVSVCSDRISAGTILNLSSPPSRNIVVEADLDVNTSLAQLRSSVATPLSVLIVRESVCAKDGYKLADKAVVASSVDTMSVRACLRDTESDTSAIFFKRLERICRYKK